MKSSLLLTLILAAGLAITALPTFALAQSTGETSAGTVQFSCGTATDPSSRKQLPATVANVPGSNESTTIIVWKSEFFGTKYTPQERCSIVSIALQKAFQEGRTYLGAGVEKASGQGIVCGLSNPEQICDRSNMLLTLKSYQTADKTIVQLSQNMKGKMGGVIYQSSSGKRVDLRNLLKPQATK